ncbi:DUF454 family protein [Corynebacterium xerosis]|uniref:DUF454 family protein n=1 Tax=Corynebacterium xerosis TaxID=1725 RepID=A0A6B8TI07_9CORY|nr:DUF454 family protein [Corynebacterium xerosis]
MTADGEAGPESAGSGAASGSGTAAGPPVLRPVESRALRWVLNGAGLVSLGLGAVGAVLPLLPTTPFLLLSALCFAKASDRLLTYLLGHPVFGSYLNQYYSGQMSMAYKLQTLGVMWLGLVTSAWLISKPWPWVFFAVIGAGVSIHILTLKPKGPSGGDAGNGETGPHR